MNSRVARLPFTSGTIFLLFVLLWMASALPTAWRAQGYAQNAVVAVSAASYAPLLAPDSIAAAFGANMATGVFVAEALPLPTELGGTTVRINDTLAPLFFVSPSQINFAIPSDTALGTATVRVTTSSGAVLNGTIEVTNTAPAIFHRECERRRIACRLSVAAETERRPGG